MNEDKSLKVGRPSRGRRGADPPLGEGSRRSGDPFRDRGENPRLSLEPERLSSEPVGTPFGNLFQRVSWACSRALAEGVGPPSFRTTTADLLADYCSLVLSQPVSSDVIRRLAQVWEVEVFTARFWTRGIFNDRTDRLPVLLLRDGDLVKAGRHSVENDIYAQEHGRFPGPFAGPQFADYHNHNNALRDAALGRLLAEPADPYPRRIPARSSHAGRRTRPRTRAT